MQYLHILVYAVIGCLQYVKVQSKGDTINNPSYIDSQEFCTAVPMPNHPSVAQCRPATDTSIDYHIEVIVAHGREFSNQCDVQLTLLGTKGESHPITVSSFYAGTVRRQIVALDDIGSPTQVTATFIGSSSLKWKCKKITVYQAFFWWSFDCVGLLDAKNNVAVYSLSGNKMYTVTVVTGSDNLGGTRGTIELNIKGDGSRETGIKTLGDNFASGSQKVVILRGSDVGKIQQIVIHNTEDDDPWYCVSMDIRADDGGVAHFPVRRWIGTPYEASISLGLNTQQLLDSAAQDIECFTRANDIISGFPQNIVILKVQCPMYCDENPFSLVRGSSIHPSTSSICQSAILDGVLSASGGELVVTVTGPLESYFEPEEKLTKVESRDYEPSPDRPTFSYFTYQSYSIDNIDKNVRVVNTYGRLSAIGRLEFRRKGVWGAVCSKGTLGQFNQPAARQACQEIGFLHGVYLEDGCSTVKGMNVCSAKSYATVAAAVQCTGTEKTVLDCTFEEPPSICSDHTYDVAVQCTNFPVDNEPLPGSIRIVDSTGAPAISGIGRLEYYFNGWGTVCDDGLTTQSEIVACRELGYDSMKAEGWSKKGCKDVRGENLCGNPAAQINVINLACDGTEKNVRNCPHESHSDIYCVHEEDIIISCEGNGDPSGVGLYRKEEFPDVSVRPFSPLINLKCGDRPINTKELRGKPGATFIARCPSGCTDDMTEIRGTFIYTDDSSVCRAAIHVGAISDSGGDIVIVLAYGQKSFIGSLRGEIQSSAFGAYGRSFMISQPIPSVHARIASQFKKNVYSHFAGESLLMQDSKMSFMQTNSQDILVTLEPVFIWCPPPGFSGFHRNLRNYVDASTIPGGNVFQSLTDFTISAFFRITGGAGTWRTILAHTECNGFTFAISNKDDIMFEQMCNPHSISTGFKPQMGAWYHVLVTFFHSDQAVSIFVNGRLVVYEKTNYVFSFKSPLTIGRSSYINTEFFEGDIKCIRIFGFLMNPTQIQEEKTKVEKPSQACPNEISSLNTSPADRYTVDGRLCLTPCVSLSSENNNVLEQDPLGKSYHDTHPSFSITCETTLNEDRFNGAMGDRFRVICPSKCCNSIHPVYGTDFYAAKSSICRAALHKGIIGNTANEIIVTLQNGITFYEGSMGHNFIKSETEYGPQSRSFTVSYASHVANVTCSNDASFIMKMPLGARRLVHCSEGCRYVTEAAVYGSNNRYSPSSSICRAALHAGVLTNKGGQVELKVLGDSHFGGSTQNDIVSLRSGYYLRSFSFLHTTSIMCTSYSLHEQPVVSNILRTQVSHWRLHTSSKNPNPPFEFTSLHSKDATNLVDQVALVSRDIHVGINETPPLFVLKDFNCDNYSLYATLVFTKFPSCFGVAFRVKERQRSYFLLSANASDSNGKGSWAVVKSINDETIGVGQPVLFSFSLEAPVHVHLTAKNNEIIAWALDTDKKQKSMIAHIKDTSGSFESSDVGLVGIQAYEAPETGVFWTNFEISTSPDDVSNNQLSKEWSAFQALPTVSEL